MASQLSYVCTPSSKPYLYQTIPHRLRLLANKDPEREAFIFYTLNKERESITRQELVDRSTTAAKNLIKLGLKRNATVGFCMSNSIKHIIMNMAVVIAGAIPFYVPIHLKDGSDLVDTFNDLGAEFLIIDTDPNESSLKILESIWPTNDKSCRSIPTLKMVVCNGKLDQETETRKTLQTVLQDNSAKDENDIELPLLLPEDTFIYFCTSGSTGKPKQVMCNHFGILNFTYHAKNASGFRNKNIYFCDRPLSWLFGYPRNYLAFGVTRMFVDTRMSTGGHEAGFLCEIIAREKCDIVFLPGYMAVDFAREEKYISKFSNVKTMLFSGERIPKTLVNAFAENFCGNIVILYGTTEAGLLGAFNASENDSTEDGIIGIPIPGTEMKMVDPDSGFTVKVGNLGELCVRSPLRFAGYRNGEDMFRECVDSQNWLHTGDVAHIRNDGNVVIDGRIKQWISSGTNKYFPQAIEPSLSKMESVEHVIAVGVPDSRLNQVVCACVFPKPGASLTTEDVMKFCDELYQEESVTMGISIKPRYCLIFDDLPLLSSGKIDRVTLANKAKEMLRL